MVPVAILGGGPHVVRLCEGLAARTDLPQLELRLHARDRVRLEVIAGHAGRAVGRAHHVRACPGLDDALAGAAVVVLLIRVGGLAARSHDEQFPREFGLVGDEGVGVGGIANAWRTLPVLDAIAARIAACAPDALVCNLMAPLGVTTRFLIERGRRAIGLCELPAVTLARWTASAAAPDAVVPAYAGLNHLGFFWSPVGRALDHPVLRAAVERGEVTADIVERFDAVPLHYFVDVFDPATARALGRERRGDRARELAALQAVLLDRFAHEPERAAAELDRRPTPWFEQSVAPVVAAELGGAAFVGPLDVPNAARLPEVSPGTVVELIGRFERAGATVDPPPPRPPAVGAMLARLARAEDLVYRAACDRDRGVLGEALAALPLEIATGDHERVLDRITAAVSPEAIA